MKLLIKFFFILIISYENLTALPPAFPPYIRATIDFRYLYAQGTLRSVAIDQLPILWVDINSFTQQFPYFLHIYAQPSKKPTVPYVTFGAYSVIAVEQKSNHQLRSLVNIELGHHLYINNVMLLDQSLADEPGYIGKSWRGFVGYTEEAYIGGEFGNTKQFSFQAGRFYDYWGPGRTGQLLQSFASRPLDQILFRLGKHNWSFTTKIAQLDAIKQNNRYLSVHRISYHGIKLQFGLSEAVLYGGENRNPELAYLNPFITYTGVQLNGPGQGANVIFSIDGRWNVRNISFYGEFLIDDIQFDQQTSADLEPNEWGVIIGLDYSHPRLYWGVEGVAITNRTYKTIKDYEWFTHRNSPLGYCAGSDLWRINSMGRYYFSSNWQIDMELDYLVRGAGEINQPWDMPWMDIPVEVGYSEPFPTGTLQREFTIELSISRMVQLYNWMSVGVRYRKITNWQHISRNNKEITTILINLSWIFEKSIEL